MLATSSPDDLFGSATSVQARQYLERSRRSSGALIPCAADFMRCWGPPCAFQCLRTVADRCQPCLLFAACMLLRAATLTASLNADCWLHPGLPDHISIAHCMPLAGSNRGHRGGSIRPHGSLQRLCHGARHRQPVHSGGHIQECAGHRCAAAAVHGQERSYCYCTCAEWLQPAKLCCATSQTASPRAHGTCC